MSRGSVALPATPSVSSSITIERTDSSRVEGTAQDRLGHLAGGVGHHDLAAFKPLALVGPEVAEAAGDDGDRSAEELRHELHVFVEGPPLFVAKRADEGLVHDEGRVDERPVHPQEQPRFMGGIAGSGRVLAQLRRDRSLHARVDRPHPGRGPVGFGLRAVDDGVDRAHRAGEPPPGALPEARVGDDAGRHEWVGCLHEQRVAAAEHEDGLPGDLPDRAPRREVAALTPGLAHRRATRIANRIAKPVGCRNSDTRWDLADLQRDRMHPTSRDGVSAATRMVVVPHRLAP